MLRFILRRAGVMVFILWMVITGMFFLLHLAPGSPVNSLPPAVAADKVARAAYEANLGLDKSLIMQYVDYMRGLLTGDMGRSLFDGSSVFAQVKSHLPVSLELGTLAAVGSMIPGFFIGIWGAIRHGGAGDSVGRIFTVLTLSVPAYWLAVLCLVFVGQQFPAMLPNAGGFVPFQEDPLVNLTVMFLPALVLGLSTFALVARSLRSSLLDILSFDYVTFANSMGMRRAGVMRRIAVRNAVIPTLTIIGVLLGTLVSGTVLVEAVFQIPGLGQLMVTAFIRQDYPLALGCSIATAIIFLMLNLVVDALYYVVDPRTKSTMVKKVAVTA